MYPANLFNLFPPFPREEKVFVAMSFDRAFEPRWRQVIEPAIRSIGLEPFRVDTRLVGDSILTDISKGIASHRLIFADISEIGRLAGDADFVVRNGNVMYEVGLAHAIRLPEEVVLFRSDAARLPFDVAPIRVHTYDPDGDIEGSKAIMARILADALREVELGRLMSVQKAVESLDYYCYSHLLSASQGPISQPNDRTMGDLLRNATKHKAIGRLVDRGMLAAEAFRLPEGPTARIDLEAPDSSFYRYILTSYGQAVLDGAAVRIFKDPKMQILAKALANYNIPEAVRFVDIAVDQPPPPESGSDPTGSPGPPAT